KQPPVKLTQQGLLNKTAINSHLLKTILFIQYIFFIVKSDLLTLEHKFIVGGIFQRKNTKTLRHKETQKNYE
ncbi:MAG: hypothetical protein QG588_1323, partial [Candidatus Poribacteria bacterium]|nr:hypothetical protein [Candidatus Poribacteria bacterium]